MERVAIGTNDCARWVSYGSPFSVVALGGTLAAGLSMVMDVTLERFPSSVASRPATVVK